LDVADSDWNLVPRCLLQVVDVGLVDFQAFAPAGVDVDLELEVMRVVAVRRGLVVDDGEPWGSAVCLVDDHVGPTGDGGVAEMQLEGPLDLPDPVQLVAPLLEVAVHQLPPPALHLAVPGAPGSREVEVVVEDPVELLRSRDPAVLSDVLGDASEYVVDRLPVADLGRERRLEPDLAPQAVLVPALEERGDRRK